MPTKSQLLASLQAVQDEISHLAESLSEYERNVSGSPDNWAPRDILVHLGQGKRFWAEDLAEARRGATPPQGDRPGRNNTAVFDKYHVEPWRKISSLITDSHNELFEQIRSFSDDDLNDPDLYDWMNGTPLWRRTAGLCVIHATVHLWQFYIVSGDHPSAERIAQMEKDQAVKLDSSNRWLGMVHYNQGCYYGMIGQKEMALNELEKAFRLAPHFIDFAQEDSDLVSLHEDPDFLALQKRVKAE